MGDRDKSREELISELKELRKRVNEGEDGGKRFGWGDHSPDQWERYRLISENTSDLIAVTTFTENPVYTYASPSHEKVMGYKPLDLIGRSGFDFIHPEDREKFLPLLERYVRLKGKNILQGRENKLSETIEYRARDASGNWHHLESSLNIMKDELLFISRDVSEQKRTVESIKLAYAELMQIFNTTVEGVRVIDGDCNVLLVNETFSTLSDVSEETMSGKKCYEVFNSQLCKTPRCPLRKILGGETRVESETEIERGNGIRVPCTVTATPFRNENGTSIGIVEHVRDITERKKMEQKVLQSEKLKSLEALAGGVAHNFNNILAAILGRAQLLMMNTQTPPGVKERREGVSNLRKSLEVIEEAALDGAHTVRRIQDFSRREGGERTFAPVDINEVIENSLEFTRARWKDESESKEVEISIEKNFSPLPPIAGDASELVEVFTNLINNAIDAMPSGGKIGIQSSTANGRVIVTVQDTGVGIPEGFRDRIFDPFFTTKGVQSAGLGLSAAYGIIKRNEGTIVVKSSEGQGASFTVSFPASEEKVEGHRVKQPAKRHGNAHVLVIEDERDIRELITDILAMNGFEVSVAKNGKEGVDLFREKTIDLVFTDLGMPGMSGWQVAKEIKKIDASTPVALITGWQVPLSRDEMKEKGVDLLINKPFRVDQVVRLVEEGMEVKERQQSP